MKTKTGTKFFVVLDQEDPGSEHDSWEEAKEVLDKYLSDYPYARIINGAMNQRIVVGWGVEGPQSNKATIHTQRISL